MKYRALAVLIAAWAFVPGVSAADATSNWETHCTSCHGADGRGETKMGKKLKIKDLTDVAYQDSFTDEDAFKAVKIGIKNDAGKTTMKAVEELADDEITALVAFVRSLKK